MKEPLNPVWPDGVIARKPVVSMALAASLVFACADNDRSETVSPENPSPWPEMTSPVAPDPAVEQRITELMARMSVEEKVGQIMQSEIQHTTPEDIRNYHLGSVLNGGGSFPNKEKRSTMQDWVDLADAFYHASMDTSDGHAAIPVIWGTDAVHGHSNVYGATIFPHNIGLGAARNPALIRRIGEATAVEVAVTGIPWTFAPTLAVVRDDRWGRTYESYSEDPAIVETYAEQMVLGIQGEAGAEDFLGHGKMLATAKHFLGDGGTTNGVDQGNTVVNEEQLAQVHGAGYFGALRAGVQTVMASFNSWNGEKMHGNQYLLTDILKERMGFDGYVVGDWNGHGQVPGCTRKSCAQAFNAGVDMFMVPEDWKDLWHNTLDQVNDGTISMNRLDDAVRRILRVKLRLGLFEKGAPSTWPYAGQAEYLGSAQHRELARQAVRESLVLLKNNHNLLPLDPSLTVLVAGEGADDIGLQTGGWTLSWQGTGNQNPDFPGGTSIFAGIEQAVSAAGGTAVLSLDGSHEKRPDVAVVVFGENPYAEFNGDAVHLQYNASDTVSLELLKKLRAEGIPVVSVFLSGRPMWVNPEINASDAFVAAWLPGTEGNGIADMLFRNADGTLAHEFKGRLTFSWPGQPDRGPLNKGDENYEPLFAYGYGLSGKEAELQMADLPADGLDISKLTPEDLFVGRLNPPWSFFAFVPSGRENDLYATTDYQSAPAEGFVFPILNKSDRRVQEDAITVEWPDSDGSFSAFAIGGFSDETDGEEARENDFSAFVLSEGQLVFDIKLNSEVGGRVILGMYCTLLTGGCGAWTDFTTHLGAESAIGEWRSWSMDLGCFAKNGMDFSRMNSPFMLATDGPMNLSLSDIRLIPGPTGPASGPCLPLEVVDGINGLEIVQ